MAHPVEAIDCPVPTGQFRRRTGLGEKRTDISPKSSSLGQVRTHKELDCLADVLIPAVPAPLIIAQFLRLP